MEERRNDETFGLSVGWTNEDGSLAMSPDDDGSCQC